MVPVCSPEIRFEKPVVQSVVLSKPKFQQVQIQVLHRRRRRRRLATRKILATRALANCEVLPPLRKGRLLEMRPRAKPRRSKNAAAATALGWSTVTELDR